MTGSILERTRKGTVYGEREYRGKKISTGNSRKKRSAQGIPGKRDQHRGYRGKEISAKKEHQTRALCLRTDALKCAVRDSNPGHPD